jgi:hypothetical protein
VIKWVCCCIAVLLMAHLGVPVSVVDTKCILARMRTCTCARASDVTVRDLSLHWLLMRVGFLAVW